MSVSIKRFFYLLVISASLMVSACGFHLRGKIDVPPSLLRLHVKGNDIELVHDIEKSLKFSDIVIVEEGNDGALLDLSNSSYVKEVNGTDANGIASNYKMTYTVNYVVYDNKLDLLQQQSVKQNRTLAYDANNILLFEREETFLVEDMRKELVSHILRRMSKIQ
jgi:LPS-assembly lipoprotein